MSRALRYSPPVADSRMIVRPRLLGHLRNRFERPVTAIVAAAGFGKTTLLAQAVRENALSPLGEDRWLTCQRDDIALSFLAAGVAEAVGVSSTVPDDPSGAAVCVAEAIWSAAPRHLALMLDDAHVIEPTSPGGAFLTTLVRELPRNGHVVLASRPPLPLHISRMLVSGDAVVLGEKDMQFQDEEVAAFAAARGVTSSSLGAVAGWPALAELSATVGPQAVEGYVWEELLSQLSPQRRDALALLVAIGGADTEIARAVLGEETDLDALLSGLPLVVRGAGGWVSLHGLWATAVQHRLEPARIAEARRTAGLVLARRRQYHESMDLLVDAQAWRDARELIVEVCEVCTPLVPPDVLEEWLRRLPQQEQAAPEGMLLAAMVAETTRPAVAAEILERTLDDAPDAGRLRYASLNALVQLAFWRSDRRRMKRLAEQLAEFDSRQHPQARGWVALLEALLARDPDDVRGALSLPSLVSGTAMNPVQDWLHTHILLLKLGDPEAAERVARRALAHDVSTMQAVSRSALAESFRMRGRLSELRDLLPDLQADLNPAKVLTSPELVTGAVVAFTVLGDETRAAQLLARFRPVVDASPAGWGPIAGVLADAFYLASTGDEDAARARLATIAETKVARNLAAVQVSECALPLLYVLLPELRAPWDEAAPPGHFAAVLSLVRALVELRERRRLDRVRALSADVLRIVRGVLPPPWVAELAVALVAAGVVDGRILIDEIGPPARTFLRAVADRDDSTIAASARTLLRELPAKPRHPLALRTLGPLELHRAGAVVLVPELRRERVRQLLAYLLTHDRPARASITAELWPDLPDSAAGRNLRVTLAYLQDALEPARAEWDPPYFVRSNAGTLALIVDDALSVDAIDFERVLDDAAQLEHQGALTSALTRYEEALDIWRGDYFAGLAGGDWLQWERDRLRRRFVSTAVRAGNLMLARGDVGPSQDLAERALTADPWTEPAYQLLMAGALTSGDRAGAQRGLRRCRDMLAELGVAAHPRTIALAQQLAAAR
jgi:LuxR family transcriptional regulator, maltose regulon positive regulatory protein